MYKYIEGVLDNFILIPRFFLQTVEMFIPLEVYTYGDCMLSILNTRESLDSFPLYAC